MAWGPILDANPPKDTTIYARLMGMLKPAKIYYGVWLGPGFKQYILVNDARELPSGKLQYTDPYWTHPKLKTRISDVGHWVKGYSYVQLNK